MVTKGAAGLSQVNYQQLTVVGFDSSSQGFVAFDQSHDLDGVFLLLHLFHVQLIDIGQIRLETGLFMGGKVNVSVTTSVSNSNSINTINGQIYK